jgi:hypothetical protein
MSVSTRVQIDPSVELPKFVMGALMYGVPLPVMVTNSSQPLFAVLIGRGM